MSEKRTLPLLPLRGLVVYPHMMVNLDVGRDRSVAAIERAIAGDSWHPRRLTEGTGNRRSDGG